MLCEYEKIVPSGNSLFFFFFPLPPIDLKSSHYMTSNTRDAKGCPHLCPGVLREKPRIMAKVSAPTT